jgi:hypothetical protein
VTEEEVSQLVAAQVPVVLYALGWTRFPWNDPTGEDGRLATSLGHLLELGAVLTVRNSGTRAVLREHLDGHKANVLADPALFIEAGAAPELPGVDWDEPVVGLCWASDKPTWRYARPEEQFTHREAVIEALRLWGGQVLLLEHIADMDDELRERLYDVLGDRLVSLEETCPELYPPTPYAARTLTGLYGKLTAVLSGRKHGLLLALGQGVPAVALPTVAEVGWFAADYGLPVARAGVTAGQLLAQITEAVRVGKITVDQRRRIEAERQWTEAVCRELINLAGRPRAVA